MLTAIWSLGIPFCWGNLYGKYGYLQVHRYMSAGALPSESQSHLWENTISRVFINQLFIKYYSSIMNHIKRNLPGCFNSLGIIQRTKWGCVLFNVVIKLFNCSYDTHTNINNNTYLLNIVIKTKTNREHKNIRLVIVVQNTLKHKITAKNRTFQVKT